MTITANTHFNPVDTAATAAAGMRVRALRSIHGSALATRCLC
jgi:hypothetical protein